MALEVWETHGFARYDAPTAAQQSLGLWCGGFGVGRHRATTGTIHPCGPRTLGCYAAVWIPRGSGWFESEANTHRYAITDNTLFWLFPTVSHTYAPDANGWTELWLLFDGPLASAFERLGLLRPEQAVLHLGLASQVAHIFRQLYDAFNGESLFANPLGGALAHQLVVVAGQLYAEGGAHDDGMTPRMREARAWLDMHATEQIDFAQVSRRWNMAYSTFRRRFHAATGYAPKEYVMAVRLNRAKVLLATTSLSIAEVAQQVGFENPLYFSRVFHAKEGRSPREFRSQQHPFVTSSLPGADP